MQGVYGSSHIVFSVFFRILVLTLSLFGGPERKSVTAPKGFHWMKHGSGYKLMKNPKGGFKAHKGASVKAVFPVQKVHK